MSAVAAFGTYRFFHDFFKAYDLASRRFVMTILHMLGVPDTYLNIIKSLFVKNRVFPLMADSHKITIDIGNGLKQGDPLSPLLYFVYIDPLLTYMELLQKTTEGAFFDDLSVDFADWSVPPIFLKLIADFNSVSGAQSNFKKGAFISTVDTTLPEDAMLPQEWRNTKIVPQHKYLGVWAGPALSVYDVFADAMDKFRRRVIQYMPYKGAYSMQNRVIISNAFLTSILAFLCDFYILGYDDEMEVVRLVSKFVIPGQRLKYDYLTARTDEVGLHQPLHDIFKMNIARLLRGRLSLPPLINGGYASVDGDSMLMSDHLREAAARFHSLAGTLPNTDTDHRTLYALMARGDETVLELLKKKLQGPARDRRLDEESAALLATRTITNASRLPKNLPMLLRNHIPCGPQCPRHRCPTRMDSRSNQTLPPVWSCTRKPCTFARTLSSDSCS